MWRESKGFGAMRSWPVSGRRAPAFRKRPPAGIGVFDWLARLVAAGLALPSDLLLLALLVAVPFAHFALSDLPETTGLRDVRYQEPLRIYSADGSLMAEFGIQRREPVGFDDIPPLLVKAFLAAEDSRFFAHAGVDLLGLLRAAREVARAGRLSQGGSTITMQLTRNLFLTPEKTLQRKMRELLLALRVEQTLTKTEILELYLNEIFFGHRAYGISAAAELYYGKRLVDLTLAEMAMLAGIPQSPSTGNPVTDPERALARRDHVLDRMRALAYIDAEAHGRARGQPDVARLHRPPPELAAGYLAEMARQELVGRFGDDVYRRGWHVYTTVDPRLQLDAQAALRKGLRDYDRRHGYRGPEARLDPAPRDRAARDAALATMTPLPGLRAGIVVAVSAERAEVYVGQGQAIGLTRAQVDWARPYVDEDRRGKAPVRLDQVVAVGDLIRLQRTPAGDWSLAQAPAVSGALLALAPQDGAILALVGGYAYRVSAFNRAVDARRQPGSSFKPFIYAAALDQGWSPASLVRDEPIRVPQARGKVWAPRNADHKTLGPVRLRVALVKSRNLATIHLLDQLGIETARAFIPRFGFAPEALPRGLSLALGAGETSPLELARGYAVFANGGYRVTPHLIQRIEDASGAVLFEAHPPRACSDCWSRYGDLPVRTQPVSVSGAAPTAERVLAPRIVFQMDSMLRDVIQRGTGQRAKRLVRSDIAGKTGTTNAVRDSWFCGYQKDFVAVAWMGFDEFTPLGRREYGGRAALDIWADFMAAALDGKPEARLDPPPGLVRVQIDARTGAEVLAPGPGRVEEYLREESLWRTGLGPERPLLGPAEHQPGVAELLEGLF